MKSRLLRRLSIGAASLAMLLSVVTPGALAAHRTASHAKAAAVTLIWFMRIEPKENPWEKERVAAFEKLNPNITIKLILAPNPNGQFDTKFNTLLNSTPADIWSHLGQAGFADYYHRHLLYNMSTLIKQYGYDFGSTPKNLINTYNIGGNIYGIPSITLGSYLYYNKDIFDAYNQAHPSAKLAYPPVSWTNKSWTWAKMVSYATKLTDASKHQYGILQGLFPFMGYAYLEGTDMFPAGAYQSGTPKTFNTTSPAIEDIFQQMADWANKSHIAPSYSDQKSAGNNAIDLFSTGKIAMEFTGGWGFRNYNSVTFHWGAAAMPTLKSNKDVLFTDPYMMYKGTAHPKEAFQFIKFLTNSDSMNSYVREVSFTPSNPDFLGQWYQLNAKRTGQSVADLTTLVAGARANGQESPNHLIVNFSEIHNRMVQDTDPIFFGQKTAKDQMPTVQDDITTVLQQTH